MDDEAAHIVLYVVFIGFCLFIGLFGIASNIINIIIFIKNGFTEAINVSLLGLAVSDLLGLLFVVPITVFINPITLQSDNLSWDAWDVFYCVMAFPLAVFFRITCFITVFITLERCLCFLLPLKVKSLITPARSTVVVLSIYVLMLATLIPAYMAVKLDGLTDPISNRTVVRMVYAMDVSTSRSLLIFMFSVNCGFQLLSLVALIVVNVALAFAVRRQTKWREALVATEPQQGVRNQNNRQQAGNGSRAAAMSQRSRRLGRMIQFLSLILLGSYLPSSILFIIGLSEYQFYLKRKYHNEFVTSWSFALMLQTINSSINIFFYYRMNTKFKSRFDKLFKSGRSKVGVSPITLATVADSTVA